MPNQNERPKYTDPDHPYSGSGPRYQNNYSRSEYHAGDGPFQFPWWAIVIGFVVWWPLGFIFIGLNTAMKNGKLGGFEEKARVRTQSFGRVNTTPVYDAEVRPLNGSADPGVQPAAKRLKGAALATGLTVAGVLLLLCALAALPSAIYWLPEALTEGGSYWTWLVEDSMPMLMSLTGGIGCLFGGWHIRTSRRMRRKIDKIVGDAKYMYIQDKTALTRDCSAPMPIWTCAANVWWSASARPSRRPPPPRSQKSSPKSRPICPSGTSTRRYWTSCAGSMMPSPMRR